MTGRPRIAVVYTHFPHYRAAVFDALGQDRSYAFEFHYDPSGIAATIASGHTGRTHLPMPTRRAGGLMWQGSAPSLALAPGIDGFIFLGNPFILSTWLAALLARLRGRPVLFWTHGWLRRETGPKALLRNLFYRLADGLLVYGDRAREIGATEGFAPERIHVIYNSLDYPAQRQARDRVLAIPETGANTDLPDRPFFLCVTRLVPGVDLGQAIEAMAHLSMEAALVVVGAGPERRALEDLACRLSVEVRFLGAIYDETRLAPLFLAARAVVSPGKVGLLAMHALAYGTPVITHEDADRQMPEVEAIEPGVTGAFFRRGDTADLARAMAGILQMTAAEAATARAAGIAMIESRYTPQLQCARITDALDAAFGRRG